MLQYVIDLCKQRDVIIALPGEHPCVCVLRKLNHCESVRQCWNGAHMIRIISKNEFCEILERRWNRSPILGENEQKTLSKIKQINIDSYEELKTFFIQSEQAGVNNPLSPIVHRPVWNILDEF